MAGSHCSRLWQIERERLRDYCKWPSSTPRSHPGPPAEWAVGTGTFYPLIFTQQAAMADWIRLLCRDSSKIAK